jgi:hypothetical protein
MYGLTHYTKSVEAVVNILSNGFAWVNNKRNLIHKLAPAHDFSEREPQQFGMISFTDREPPAPTKHRREFGEFGVVVSCEWARSKMAQPVLYVPEEGPVVITLRWLFKNGYEQLKSAIKYPDDAAAQMAFTNKAMARVQGGLLWSNLLTLYEYMEPADNAYQSEWRIVHSDPLYGYPSSIQEIIQRVSPPRNWAKHLNVLRAPDDAVIGFVCPRRHQESFARALPSSFSSKPIRVYEG